MRTTLTIDDDVEALLRQRLRASGEPLKQAVNKYLRLGILAEEKQAVSKKPFKLKPSRFGLPTHFHIDSTSELLEKLEDPNWP
ncbi:hypothetical protein [Terriglobus sp. RCC_193]|uniref:hypothetical protein n=1 Tax=Terriglobus sp. RCC_193 TaxID=3239218 RepID=UPI0035257B52